ncbi:MAG: N-acetyltransferase family protein [Clostridia bacterium]
MKERYVKEIQSTDEHIDELSQLLITVVDQGASIGFLPPLSLSDAKQYWDSVLSPGVILYVAVFEGRIAGTIQLHLCMKQNGRHRAEVAKLMTHPDSRRNGIARTLLEKVEERAIHEGRTLLVLDTREGDPSNLLYRSMNYQQVGRIPYFAATAEGELQTTVLYYKVLPQALPDT